ncbi:MAG: hypothetical protein IJQ82_08255 [Selenomonadaceae bacterium]|nr:hypothetical protein [Selenomonadaceae bacterium]
MKDDFLTIPDAPNYEINSELICRHISSGKIIPLHTHTQGRLYYTLRDDDGKSITRTSTYFRRIAVAAVTPDTFEPILSLDYRYEINHSGTVRNTKTKRIVKPIAKNRKSISFRDSDRNCICRNIDELLWEVHGRTFKPTKQPCPCSIQRGAEFFSFPSLRACAIFLADKLFYTVSTVAYWLCKRPPVIADWHITYLNPVSDIKWNSRALNREAHRQSRIERKPS